MGARYLYIQGGEPFAWQDGSRRLDHVVDEAKGIGFFHVAVCTNGTFPLDADPDSFSVSLDGRPGSHDSIRGGSFERVIANVEISRHPYIFANVTFNRQNRDDLAFLADFAAASRRLRGILVNFHIPYPGVEHLALSMVERARLAEQAMELKRRGYPIMNTLRRAAGAGPEQLAAPVGPFRRDRLPHVLFLLPRPRQRSHLPRVWIRRLGRVGPGLRLGPA